MICSWCKCKEAFSDGLCYGCLDTVLRRQEAAMAKAAEEKGDAHHFLLALEAISEEYAEEFGATDPVWWYEHVGINHEN